MAHAAVALDAAREGIVLLRNTGGTLPIDRGKVGSVAVVGALADRANLGDHGSSDAKPSQAVTPLAGIGAAAGAGVAVAHFAGPTLSAQDDAAIQAAGAAVVVVGLTADDEGENLGTLGGGGDRKTLGLSKADEDLVVHVASIQPRTVVVLEGGSAIAVATWIEKAPAVLMAWYPGQEGGRAIAEVLFGDVCPSGKLPVTFPASAAQLPPFVHDADAVTYGYFHGYRWVDREGHVPTFPFGFGLSCTTFAYGNLNTSAGTMSRDGSVRVRVDVTNTGARAGQEVVELYVGTEGSAVERPVRQLARFAKVAIEPGQTRTVEMDLAAADLAFYDVAARAWVVEPIRYVLGVGGSSRDLPLGATIDVVP